MPRVHEVARALGLSSREVLTRLHELNILVTSHASSIDDGAVKRLRAAIADSDGLDAVTTSTPTNGPAPGTGSAPDYGGDYPVPSQWGGGSISSLGAAPAGPAATGEPAPATTPAPGPDRDQRPAVGGPVPLQEPPDPWGPGAPVSAPDEPGAPLAPPGPGGPVALRPVTRKRRLGPATEIPLLVVLAFVIAIIVKSFVVQAFYIPSGSMIPTLRVGDRVLVEKVSFRFRDVRRGDVVVFEKSVFGGRQSLPWYDDARNFMRELLGLPTSNTEDYIKRVVAIGGDEISYVGKPRRLLVNGKPIDEPFVNHGRDRHSARITRSECRDLHMKRSGQGCLVPRGKLFVMGDNRGDSEDSRVIGPIGLDKIVGRAFAVVWPPADFGGL